MQQNDLFSGKYSVLVCLFSKTSQKFNDVRMWFQLLHCFKFFHQISLI